METQKTSKTPTVLVVFGVTGDLMSRKILPALYRLYEKEKLPKQFSVIGYSRRNLTNNDFHKVVQNSLNKYLMDLSPTTFNSFKKLFSYHQGRFESLEDYKKLAERLGKIDNLWQRPSNKLFYLAVPPNYYEGILKRLSKSGLTSSSGLQDGWTKILVEKPFGKNLEQARKLDDLLSSLFKDEQIYPIDHYLAKEMLQNILTFRFTNNLFEDSWDNKSIDKIYIRVWEKIGVEERGVFYDGIGALRDVGQNHLLQMLALVTMNQPESLEAIPIRKKRAEILRTLIPPSTLEIVNNSYRAQYEGYKNIKGVSHNSSTETYFSIRAFLSASRWRGVPITMESGKRMGDQIKEIVVTFKHKSPCFCPIDGPHLKNKIIFRVEPNEEINIRFWSRKPGFRNEIEERSLDFLYRDSSRRVQYVEEYERILLDCFIGDQTLFTSTAEVKAMWKFVDPIFSAWQKNLVPLKVYQPDTNQAHEDSRYIKDGPLLNPTFKKEIGLIGLGKMGKSIARRLLEKEWKVVGFNRSPQDTDELAKGGLVPSYSLAEVVSKLSAPRIIWLMLPAGKIIDDILFGNKGLTKYLQKGDYIIDGSNSFYKDSIIRYKKLSNLGFKFNDVGFSGGPDGARNGGCLMVGGEENLYDFLKPLYFELAKSSGLEYFPGVGAGHFVKMIHNGIEYGMMQSIAEGFTILKKAKYDLDLAKVADIYNHGSVIESRLIGWLKKALEIHTEDLTDISGTVDYTGEGNWTVETAKELGLSAKVIEDAVRFRMASKRSPNYLGKILSALREQFGRHSVIKG
ncbi:glucose-6-phosphate dehydrogenase [Candidatus Gottesmanbacteria bacterium]|nr:glucose-6-phosphate dehydrogenase [Candidatus Gottesmanbacteria bacterium]